MTCKMKNTSKNTSSSCSHSPDKAWTFPPSLLSSIPLLLLLRLPGMVLPISSQVFPN